MVSSYTSLAVFTAIVLPLTAAGETIIVTGAKVDSRLGSVPQRRNILDLHAEGGAQWFVSFHLTA